MAASLCDPLLCKAVHSRNRQLTKSTMIIYVVIGLCCPTLWTRGGDDQHNTRLETANFITSQSMLRRATVARNLVQSLPARPLQGSWGYPMSKWLVPPILHMTPRAGASKMPTEIGSVETALIRMLGKKNTQKVVRIQAVQNHLVDGTLLRSIQRLKTDFDISGEGLVTFMTHSVAIRLADDTFWVALKRLKEEPGISGDSLVKFMSGSVATRLGDETFWAALKRLEEEHGISGDSLVTFMSDSVAARLGDETLWAALKRLKEESGISGDSLVTFMSNSVAARLGDETFWAALKRLKEESGISGDSLVKFMSNSVATRLGDETFWAALKRLKEESSISGDSLVTFMSNSVAARLSNEDFMDAISLMCSELSPKATVALMANNNPLASRMTLEYAHSIIRTVKHLDSCGFDGSKTLKKLIGRSPLVGKVQELGVLLLSMDTHDDLQAFMQKFRGSYKHKRKMALTIPAQ